MHKIKKLFYEGVDFMAPFIIMTFAYLTYSFIAWDFNPMHWLLFTTWIGRIFTVIHIFSLIKLIIEYYED
jgi:hypothetical protein